MTYNQETNQSIVTDLERTEMMELANKELTTAVEKKSVKLETEQRNYPMKTRESKRLKKKREKKVQAQIPALPLTL